MSFIKRMILLQLLLLLTGAGINAQTVSGVYRNTSVKQVLEDVEHQTGYRFFYDESQLSGLADISASFDKVSLKQFLDKVLGPGFTYSINGSLVSISLKSSMPSDAAPSVVQQSMPVSPTITGKVVDENGEPVIGAAVMVKGDSTKGVLTGLEGDFSLKAEEGSVLNVVCIGYRTEEVRTEPGKACRVVLHEQMDKLSESVVVGYGVQKKESVVGAISQISTKDLLNSGQTNVTHALTGKLSGVLTMQSSGKPGENDAEILIRGISSWNGSSPLVMVDGVERAFNELDPNEIATISVLKDASATAVFGAKGANGVILVTTRTGEVGKPRITFTATHGFNFSSRLPEHIDAFTTATAYNVAMMNSGNFSELYSAYDLAQYKNPSTRLNSIRYPDNDWYEILLRDVAHSTDANVNLSGGNDRVRYFISLGYKNEGPLFKSMDGFDSVRFKYDRLTYRANLDFDLTSSTRLSYKVGGSLGIQRAPGTSPISYMYAASTISYPAYYPSWVLEEVPDPDYPGVAGSRMVYTSAASGVYYSNPYNCIGKDAYSQSTGSRLYTDLLLDQDLDFITEGLRASAKFSYSTNMSRVSEQVSATRATYYLDWDVYDLGIGNPWIPSKTTSTVIEDAPYGASQGSISSFNYNLYWEASLNYNRSWNKHHVTGLVLFNQKENASGASFKYRNQAVVSRATYEYAGKYLVEANVGYTGSEQFAPSNRYGLFPSVAVGYVVSKENFWKQALPWWSKMKLRYSDGIVGSDQTASRWLYFSSYSTVTASQIKEDSAANITARWETARKRDLGLDMGWLKDRLTMSVDLFDEQRTDMLIDPNVTIFVGVDYKEVNRGAIKKHGAEFEIGWKDKLPCGLGYDIHGMVSLNENRIINYEDPPYAPDYQKKAGKAYGGQTNGISAIESGYYTNVDDIHRYPNYSTDWLLSPVGAYKYLDYTADGIINSSDLHAVYGSSYPSTVYSFGGGLKYKGWEFNFLFYGNRGKYVNYNGSFELDFNKGDKRLSKSMSDYWTPVNPDAGHATMVPSSGTGHLMYSWAGYTNSGTSKMMLEGRTWRRSDYLSLRDVYLGYTIKSDTLRSMTGINSMILYMTANDLFYVTDLIEGNPQPKEFTTGLYPLMANVQIGLKVGF